MSLDIAIVGATGAVGAEFLRLLEGDRLPVGRLRPLASAASRGRTVRFRGEDLPVEVLGADSFEDVDLALFSAGASRSLEFAPIAAERGAVVVDNSSAFRMDPRVPLVIPEINADALDGSAKIVANPNCTTIVALMAVAPIARAAGAVEMRAASYQAVSGAGAKAVTELLVQTAAHAAGEESPPEVFDDPIAFNVIPFIGDALPGGETTEERKLRDESRKILGLPDLRVSATCVRVPVLRAHCVAVWLRTRREVSPEEARGILDNAPGVMVLDGADPLSYPMPIGAAGREAVQVGRIRADESCSEPGLAFFVAGDQLLKGAALNAVQIAEALISKGFL